MSEDLIARLRGPWAYGMDAETADMMRQAADEIARLSRALDDASEIGNRAIKVLAAERERVIEECAKVADAYGDFRLGRDAEGYTLGDAYHGPRLAELIRSLSRREEER